SELGVHAARLAAEKRQCGQLEYVVRAVAENDLLHGNAEARGERSLELETVAVGIAGELLRRRGDRGQCLGARTARLLVRGELDDGALVEAELPRHFGNGLPRLVGSDGAYVVGRQHGEVVRCHGTNWTVQINAAG